MDAPVLNSASSPVWCDGAPRSVILTHATLEVHGKKFRRIPLTEILGIDSVTVGALPWCYKLPILTFKRSHRHRSVWLPRKIVLRFDNMETCETWRAALASELASDPSRPRRLLVFVNPASGSKDAVARFKRVQKLFDAAGITYQPVVTTHAGHASEVIAASDLTQFDGAVGVGGDGLLHEMVSSMLQRADQARITIGVLPAGSTDTVACSTMGTNDLFTAAAHIIIGDRHALDAARVHFADGSSTIATNFISHGFFADTLKKSEQSKWLGTSRYSWAGFKALASSKKRAATIQFVEKPPAARPGHVKSGYRVQAGRKDDDTDEIDNGVDSRASIGNVFGFESGAGGAGESDEGETATSTTAGEVDVSDESEHRCHTGDAHCLPLSETLVEDLIDITSGAEIDGEFSAVSIALMSLINAKSPGGVSPHKHLSDGSMDLIVVKKCSRVQFLRFLTRLRVKSWNPMTLPAVTCKACVAIRLDTMNPASSWNIDGELYVSAQIDVQVIPAAYSFFARGIERGAIFERVPLPPGPARRMSMVFEEESVAAAEADPIPEEPVQQVEFGVNTTRLTFVEVAAQIQPDCVEMASDVIGLIEQRSTATSPVPPAGRHIATQTGPLAVPRQVSVAVAGCYAPSCSRTGLTVSSALVVAPRVCYCFSSTCPNRTAFPCNTTAPTPPPSPPPAPVSIESDHETVVDDSIGELSGAEAGELDEPEASVSGGTPGYQTREESWETRHPGLTDPFALVERYIQQRHFRLLDFFQTLSRCRPQIGTADLATRLVEIGLGLNDVQVDELIHRLDLNNDSIVKYRDLASCRRRYTLRMKAADPAWQKFNAFKDDVHYKDTFVVTPSPRHVYPAI